MKTQKVILMLIASLLVAGIGYASPLARSPEVAELGLLRAEAPGAPSFAPVSLTIRINPNPSLLPERSLRPDAPMTLPLGAIAPEGPRITIPEVFDAPVPNIAPERPYPLSTISTDGAPDPFIGPAGSFPSQSSMINVASLR